MTQLQQSDRVNFIAHTIKRWDAFVLAAAHSRLDCQRDVWSENSPTGSQSPPTKQPTRT